MENDGIKICKEALIYQFFFIVLQQLIV